MLPEGNQILEVNTIESVHLLKEKTISANFSTVELWFLWIVVLFRNANFSTVRLMIR